MTGGRVYAAKRLLAAERLGLVKGTNRPASDQQVGFALRLLGRIHFLVLQYQRRSDEKHVEWYELFMGLIKGMEALPLTFLQIWRRAAILSRECSTAHLQQHHSGMEQNLRLWAGLQNSFRTAVWCCCRSMWDVAWIHQTNVFCQQGCSDKGLFKRRCKKWNWIKTWRWSPFWFCFRLHCLVAPVFPVSVTDAAASAVFQTTLTVCHRKRPKLCKQLLKRIMEYLSSRSAAPGVRSESTETHFLFWDIPPSGLQAGIGSPFTNFFPLVLFWCSSRTRPRVASLTPSYSWLTSLFYVVSTRNISRVSWWTWPSIPSPTSPFRG